jgi:hypothetical protein
MLNASQLDAMLNASQLDAFCTDQGKVTLVLTLKSAWFVIPGGKQYKPSKTQLG